MAGEPGVCGGLGRAGVWVWPGGLVLAGREAFCPGHRKEVVVVRTGHFVDRRAGAAIVGAHGHLVLAAAVRPVGGSPSALGLDRDRLATL